MKEISECYSSAKFLRVKRDPKESLASICSLTYKVRKSFSNEVSKDQIGNFMLGYWEDALIKYHQFKQENPNRVYEVNFEDLIKDPVSIIGSIYKEFNFEWDSNLKNKLVKDVKNQIESNNAKKHIYSLNDFGLNKEEVEKRLSI